MNWHGVLCVTLFIYISGNSCKLLQVYYYQEGVLCVTLLAVTCRKKNIRNTVPDWPTTIKIKRRTDINQGIFIPQGWMISAQTTQLDLQQTFDGKLTLLWVRPMA